jgi:hypothetical protein
MLGFELGLIEPVMRWWREKLACRNRRFQLGGLSDVA